jgi:hypothetical protein
VVRSTGDHAELEELGMRNILVAAALLIAAGSASAQTIYEGPGTYSRYGNTVYGPNGPQTQYGGTTYG